MYVNYGFLNLILTRHKFTVNKADTHIGFCDLFILLCVSMMVQLLLITFALLWNPDSVSEFYWWNLHFLKHLIGVINSVAYVILHLKIYKL